MSNDVSDLNSTTLMSLDENQLQTQSHTVYKSILGMNIQSLGFHLNELKILLENLEDKPDMIAITETWMTENDDPNEFFLEGYQPIKSFPREDAK